MTQIYFRLAAKRICHTEITESTERVSLGCKHPPFGEGYTMVSGSEVLVAVHGSFVVDLDDGVSKTSVLLNDQTKGLLLQPGIWSRTHSYTSDCVALILASEEYERGKVCV